MNDLEKIIEQNESQLGEILNQFKSELLEFFKDTKAIQRNEMIRDLNYLAFELPLAYYIDIQLIMGNFSLLKNTGNDFIVDCEDYTEEVKSLRQKEWELLNLIGSLEYIGTEINQIFSILNLKNEN